MPLNLQRNLAPILPTARVGLGETFKYQVLKGNNAKLIEKILQNRSWWSEHNSYGSYPHLKWSPCSIKGDFQKLNSLKG
jgi:hypothetical protein